MPFRPIYLGHVFGTSIATVKNAAGATSDELFATIDFLPTFAKLCGCELPKDRVIDGVDQTELLAGGSSKRSQFVYMHSNKQRIDNPQNGPHMWEANGIRIGKWKYQRAEQKIAPYAVDKKKSIQSLIYTTFRQTSARERTLQVSSLKKLKKWRPSSPNGEFTLGKRKHHKNK